MMAGDSVASNRVPLTPKDADFAHFRVVGDSQHADPKRPTVAFLDIFDDMDSTHPTYFDGEYNPVSHGETSAGAVERRGYNILRLHYTDERFQDNDDLPRALKELAAGIETGKVRLGKGDALNVSFQSYRFYYPEMGGLVDMNIEPTNVKENRAEILRRICQTPDGERLSVEQRDNVHALCEMKTAINRIQNAGVEVVSIAGNDGENKFDWGFLAADKVLSAVDTKGELYRFSGTNNFTVQERGSYAVTYERQNLFSPEPLLSQLGIYKFADSPVYFEAKKVHGIHSSRNFYAPIDGLGHLSDPQEPTNLTHLFALQSIDTIKQLSSEHSLARTVANDLKPHPITTQQIDNAHQTSFVEQAKKLSEPLDHTFTKMLAQSTLIVNEKFLRPYPYEAHPIGYVAGTSYSNIKYFWDDYDRFSTLKNHK